mmetsp:Transcript_29774/g.69375  ORF Transcript_29774/g.69375 Transcript_29774/m.69375 type:complete len:133 (-) Transcript_29774:99-497(-)
MNVVEIAPGQHLTFHGVHETKTAIQRNSFVGPISCGSCQESLFCIQGAAYCQCPLCDAKTFLFHNWNEGGGVGLGFTLDDLEQLQWTATTTTTTSSRYQNQHQQQQQYKENHHHKSPLFGATTVQTVLPPLA